MLPFKNRLHNILLRRLAPTTALAVGESQVDRVAKTSAAAKLEFSFRFWLVAVFIGGIAVTWSIGYADTCVDPSSGISFECADDSGGMIAGTKGIPERAIAQVLALVGAVEKQIDAVATGGAFKPLGKKILTVLTLLVITWTILKNMILKGGIAQIMTDAVFPIIVLGLGFAALDKDFALLVKTSVESLGSALGGGGSPTGPSGAQKFAANMLMGIKSMWAVTPPSKGILDMDASWLVSVLLQLVAAAFMFLGTAIGLGVLFMAKFQVALALALAPVMIPWLVWKPTEFLFSGWLTFLLKGCFIGVAVAAIESAIRGSVTKLSSIGVSAGPGIESVITFGAISLMAMLFAFLLLKSAEIGAGVIGGAVTGFGGFNAVSSGKTASAVSGGASGAGGMAAGATGGAMKMAAAAGMGAAHKGKQQISGAQAAMIPSGGLSRVAYEMGRGRSVKK